MNSHYTASHKNYSHPKPLITATIATTHRPNSNAPQFPYEPTSVLDVRRSPSPVMGRSDSVNNFTGFSDDIHLDWSDWDSSVLLGLEEEKEDSISVHHSKIPPYSYEPQIPLQIDSFDHSFLPTDFNSNSSNIEFNCSHLDQLIRAASSVEAGDFSLANNILARLNQSLQSPIGKPLQRSSFYFKEALQRLLSGSPSCPLTALSSFETVQRIKAYKAFSEISPLSMFANFSTNQAFLESLNGARFIHIVDFEFGLGGHWASFMQEIACRPKPPSTIRITAVIPEESSALAPLITNNLQLFAYELKIQFQIGFVLFKTFEAYSFNCIEFDPREVKAVNLSPSIFRCQQTPECNSQFLRYLHRIITPKIMVFVDGEGCREAKDLSFRRNFVNGVGFYSSVFESLEAVKGGEGDLIERIEKFVFRPKIISSVAAAANNQMLHWQEMLVEAKMVPVRFSDFTESQAEWLVRRTQVKGFHVVKHGEVLLLCWQGRELVAISGWRC